MKDLISFYFLNFISLYKKSQFLIKTLIFLLYIKNYGKKKNNNLIKINYYLFFFYYYF